MDDQAPRRAQPVGEVAPVLWWYSWSTQRVLRLAARLVRMSPLEVGQRLAGKFRRFGHIEREHRRRYCAESQDYQRQFLAAVGGDAIAYVSDRLRDSFFFGPEDRQSLVAAINASAPAHASRVLAQADLLYSTGVNLLGEYFVVDGEPVDWQADPVSGWKLWPDDWIDEAFAISVADGDVKHVWEVNRHQYLTTLGRAYWFSGDTRYRDSVVRLVEHWIASNPPGPGVNWCSHLEVAVRSISWLWTLPMVLDAFEKDEAPLRDWLKSIAAHYYHLTRNLSVFTDPTNHLIGEATALWMLAICFPELPDAAKYRALAAKQIQGSIIDQNHEDGVNTEQATSYHRFVLDFYVQFKVLAEKSGEQLPEEADDRIRAMFEYAAALAGKFGLAPMIGDSDDARGVPFLELVGWDFRDVVSTGALLYENGSWKDLAESIAPLSIWILGADSAARFLEMTEKSEAITRTFPEGGYCFMDNVLRDGSAELIFDCGELGLWPNAAHGHADALAVQLRIDGEFLLGDPGTGAYFHSERVRDYFRLTSSHNTVSLGNRDQADIFGPFKWINPFNIVAADFIADSLCVSAVAEHDGYRRLKPPGRHRRAVFSVSGLGWLLVDLVSDAPGLVATRHFQFCPQAVIEIGEQGLVFVRSSKTGKEIVITFGEPPQELQLEQRSDGAWSTAYGELEPNVSLHASSTGRKSVLTFIAPSRDRSAGCITPRVVTQDIDSAGISYTIQNGDSDHRSASLFVSSRPGEIIKINELETDAEVVLCIYGSSNKLQQCVLLGAGAKIRGPAIPRSCARGPIISSYSGD